MTIRARHLFSMICLLGTACAQAPRARKPALPSGSRAEKSPAPADCLDALGPRDSLLVSADGHLLFRGDCERPAVAKVLGASETANFRAGLLTPDRRAYLYGENDGIWAVDVDSSSKRRVVTTPVGQGRVYASPRPDPHPECIYVTPPGEPKIAYGTWVDQIVGLVDDGATLVLYRHPYCCAAPSGYYVRVSSFRDPTRARAHVARPIRGIAAVGTTLFMIDGGGLWKSEDRGGRWLPVEMRGLPVVLWSTWQLDASSGGPLFAIVPLGDHGAGALHASMDAGVHWNRVPTPADAERKENAPPKGLDPAGVAWIEVSGDVLVVGTGVTTENLYGNPLSDEDGVSWRSWTSRDRGVHWTATTGQPPKRPQTTLIGADIFEGTADGVVRIREGERTIVTPELDLPYEGDLFGGAG